MFVLPRVHTMPGSTWTQKLSGSTVLFVIALVCFIIGWVTRLQILVTVAYVLFIVVALMGLYALCFTTKLSKGSVVAPGSGFTSVVPIQTGQHPGPYPATSITMPPVYAHSTMPGFHSNLVNDTPPPYSVAVKQP
ncbi:hypothetical protein BIW11_07909 [Tropilaelaps mercedesae]|uniref:Uncharacterized protein n=1 Tax=Tropilaelaps mercedesae TaxID=418985 RepID=A0A1V9XS23_9ACAR|nr:hypothetical protein BIW11_07909 [Tropilaelaps mercedesae]